MLKGMPDVSGLSIASLIGNLVSFGGAILVNGIFGKTWGIVNQYGIPILAVDSVASVGFDSSSTVSNLPVEKGTFVSYNKVSNPSTATVQLNKSTGGALQRGAFLTQLKTLEESTLSFHIITPEYVYMNYQIIGTSMGRSASDGATLLKVNLDLQEIREAVVNYEKEDVTNPSDSQTVDGGDRQSTPVSKSVLAGLFG